MGPNICKYCLELHGGTQINYKCGHSTETKHHEQNPTPKMNSSIISLTQGVPQTQSMLYRLQFTKVVGQPKFSFAIFT